ncbi:uncharacterized protein L3040_009497 [Drepanopeziza brunnea f. sp. 'multigermtubi']|uniref:uncharacterized protein n=1 Tax=Drepanopeziza brunnea f. sp. 'multigermtubi' TaxID=698441 RepID=UPI0023888974|nr:hypothetical protein L3040_009497 [Drepanopeziza brunnea f. sp. 'multigermtubi']
MSSAVADLDAGLQAMLSLKPPGVSGSRIQSITTLCTANVQSESVLIQKLFTHFKKAPATHKLGVLYVVDSVTRKWTEQAKSAGQPIDSSAQDGTFAAGVHRVKELLPVLMNDIAISAPDDQKDKIRKLLDIWEKGMTFPVQMLDSFKEKLNAQNTSTTPPGSPPPDLQKTFFDQPAPNSTSAAPARNTSSILEALANMARQSAAAPTPPANPYQQPMAVDSSYNVSYGQNNTAQQIPALNPLPLPLPLPVNVPVQAATQGSSNSVPNYLNNNPYPAPPPVAPAVDPALQQQLLLIKTLADQGMQAEQIAGILAAMGLSAGGFPPAPSPFAAQNPNAMAQNSWAANQSRDRDGFDEAVRSPPGGRFGRSRSRSPKPEWNARDSPATRRYEEQNSEYERGFPDRNRGNDDRGRGGRGGRGNDYRQRSPLRRAQSPTSLRTNNGSQKWISHDSSIKPGHIKVLSRTLFVGGVTASDHELRALFSQHGQVQTCIVNKDKRHAFVKMVSRQDAVAAKEAMEKSRSPESQLRTRWGVGFGPRDCSDYQTGVSIIPINALTDADRKWMLTAEYGGTGGKPMETGMVVEEPDIEIGQGVSSKAMSRRMQTDQAGNNGPKSTRKHPEDKDEHPRFRRGGGHRRDEGRKESKVSGPPAMPPIPPFGMAGFPFSMPNGMPMLPPGFPAFPGFPGAQEQTPQQPPPPGNRS